MISPNWGFRYIIFVLGTLLLTTVPSRAAVIGDVPPNDDGSSSLIPLDFTFRLFGVDHNSLYVNNNGNLTFSDPLFDFTPDAFPSIGPTMIAPFWADVDTRNGKGSLTYSGNSKSFTANWNNVGYFYAFAPANPDLRNTFSVTIQNNNGIIFQYGSMTWTTGDASGGINGFGGAPATLGLNKGDGTTAVVFKQFNTPDVSSLNGTKWYFQTDNANLPTMLYKQFTAPWGTAHTLGSSTDVMQQTGCFVTSTAMVLNALGHNTDPGKLNDFLTPKMSIPGALTFTEVPQSLSYGQTDGLLGPPVRFRSATLTATPSAGALPPGVGDLSVRAQLISELQTEISQEGPVILRVPSRNDGMNGYGTTETHAIVAYQVVGDQIMIRDPGWIGSPSTLDDYIDFVNNYVDNVQHKPQWQLTNIDKTGTGHDLSWLLTNHSTAQMTYVEALTPFSKQIIQGAANSPVELVIVDPLGRRLGFDPVHGIHYNEIPDSSYFRELQAADAIDGDPPLTPVDQPLEFTIGDYISGEYQIDVFGTGDGHWSINFGVSDPVEGFDPFQFALSGTATNGSFQEFMVPVLGPETPVGVPEPSSVVLFIAHCGVLLCILGARNVRRAVQSPPFCTKVTYIFAVSVSMNYIDSIWLC